MLVKAVIKETYQIAPIHPQGGYYMYNGERRSTLIECYHLASIQHPKYFLQLQMHYSGYSQSRELPIAFTT